ncbi:deSI-like protein At4g17486 [Juglans microcarpa x Juglans regia]|uniref:deSI-like protein At4g17486 n=1 Tax=Juglans microcarpa x Juglans regia TaxID=2249226 RepID=UPI001B7EC115|nr:deSI-like protein At4g17486 [Juglans microcarpa x Juglans regia]
MDKKELIEFMEGNRVGSSSDGGVAVSSFSGDHLPTRVPPGEASPADLAFFLKELAAALCRFLHSRRAVTVRKIHRAANHPYLNVYDLTSINGYAYWLGLGVYHFGVQVHDVEYAFGAHDHGTSGVFEVEPKRCPGFTFRKSILIGRTDLGPKEVHAFMEKLAEGYCGNTYYLITKNCNHFYNDVCTKLIRKPIPRWQNTTFFARIDAIAQTPPFCNCR